MIRFLLSLAFAVLPLHASQLSLRSVKQPLYMHSDEDPVIRITDVPIVSFYADPEWRFSAISKPSSPPPTAESKHPAM